MSIPILMYHQIDTPEARGAKLRGLTVAPGRFARQMALLYWCGWRGLSMDALQPYLDGSKQGKVVGLTFDDGYQNNVLHALPVLQRYGFSATCYAVSGQIGGSNQWDLPLGIRQKPLMNDYEWRTWRDAGMDIGAHGRTHADLTQLDSDQALEEITRSREELESMFACRVRHFCYPYGHYTAAVAQQVRDAGYTSATTTQRGRARIAQDRFTLPRIMIARACHPLLFAMKTMTAYEERA